MSGESDDGLSRAARALANPGTDAALAGTAAYVSGPKQLSGTSDTTSARLQTYLDVQNTLNTKNIEGTSHSFNYKQSASVRGLPIIPILGLRGEI